MAKVVDVGKGWDGMVRRGFWITLGIIPSGCNYVMSIRGGRDFWVGKEPGLRKKINVYLKTRLAMLVILSVLFIYVCTRT